MNNNFFNHFATLCNRAHDLEKEILYRQNRNLETKDLEEELVNLKNRISYLKKNHLISNRKIK